ncbi:carbohydrate ABC transporter permease [Promicromonospora citrea]|uniref:Sugar ABC transporter permease n=1 Tax=Promicromonospora citrea TaxID=43677 RepID=A0A8H9L136_9MICO|nr:sugar ABC transporter permease [Promicromonospora citrea]NNH50684.1 sugar ABC transporter permease [Promicromonospora citrea]GGM11504.1 sugar ABC transporter permease [Promicromonospora citrea]
MKDLLKALPWIGPAVALIATVVLFPVGLMFWNSTRDISQSGVDKGGVGLDNFAAVVGFDAFWPILGRTVVWVVVVVACTLVISLALAALLNKAFPGRRLVRMAVIVPWASSVVMTTLVVHYGLEPYFGIINSFLVDVGLIDTPEGYGWTRHAGTAFAWAMVVAVFVSLPFTTYTILAGLQTVPGETVEAARLDGANGVRTYLSVVLPQLRGAVSVAVLINIINVFNSLPILRVMTGSIPGYDADTVMTMIFKYMQNQRQIDLASALSVIAFLVVVAIVAVYVRFVRPLEEV